MMPKSERKRVSKALREKKKDRIHQLTISDKHERETRPPVMRPRQLRHPRRDNRIDEPDADPRDHTSADEHAGVDAAPHESGADHAEAGANPDALFAAELVARPAADETAPHGAEIIRRRQPALLRRVGDDPVGANLRHLDEAGRAGYGA